MKDYSKELSKAVNPISQTCSCYMFSAKLKNYSIWKNFQKVNTKVDLFMK